MLEYFLTLGVWPFADKGSSFRLSAISLRNDISRGYLGPAPKPDKELRTTGRMQTALLDYLSCFTGKKISLAWGDCKPASYCSKLGKCCACSTE